MFHNQSNLFKDPKIDYPIYDLQLNFSDYIAQCKQIIAHTRLDLNPHVSEKIIEANAPFELRPHQQNSKIKYGALLIHGLFDSPFFMREIGQHLQEEGLLVRGILLPGHGSVPGALLNIDYLQWLQALRYGMATLAKEVDQIFLVGFSTGGSLALYHALQDTTNIAGIILLSPAIKIRNALDFITNWHRVISWAWKRAAWFHIDPEETLDYVKYRSIPFNAVYQVYRLAQQIIKISPPVQPTCPLFFGLSLDDITVCSQTSIRYFKQHAHQQSRMILFTRTPNAQNDDSRVTFRNSVYPDMRVIDFSHICIPISPNNSHYGKNGDYPYASHVYHTNNLVFGEFNSLEEKANNLLFKLNLTPTLHSRLTFNPDFKFLVQAMNQFIESC